MYVSSILIGLLVLEMYVSSIIVIGLLVLEMYVSSIIVIGLLVSETFVSSILIGSKMLLRSASRRRNPHDTTSVMSIRGYVVRGNERTVLSTQSVETLPGDTRRKYPK